MGVDYSTWGEALWPSGGDDQFGWRIKRASHLKPTKLAIISNKHYGVYTHYWHRRTVPHLRVDCEACADGQEPRWYGYFLALVSPSKEKVVFEFTAKVAEIVAKAEDDFLDLRGLIVLASRPGGRENSPVHIQVTDGRFNPADLPPVENIRPILAKIWGYRPSAAIAPDSEDRAGMSEHQRVSTKEKKPRVRVSDAQVSSDGEIQGMAQELAGQLHMPFGPSPNGNQPK